MEIGVKADVVLPERGNDIVPAASFQSARLLADDLECGPNVSLGEQVRHALGRVVRGRKQIVLRVEPQNDINPRRILHRVQTPGKSRVTRLKRQREKNQPQPLRFHESVLPPGGAKDQSRHSDRENCFSNS